MKGTDRVSNEIAIIFIKNLQLIFLILYRKNEKIEFYFNFSSSREVPIKGILNLCQR